MVLAPLGVPDHDVGAAELGEHARRDLPGVGAGVVRGHVLGAVPDLQPVAVDQRLHRAEVGERRQHDDLDPGVVVLLVAERPGELLDQRDGLGVVEVHLPVARHQRDARLLAISASVLGSARRGGQSESTAMPGSCLPSRYSRLAPPPVEMCPKAASSKPSCAHRRGRVAAADDRQARRPRSAPGRPPGCRRRTASNSNTPIGPFQNTVRASASAAANARADSGPMSRPSWSAGIRVGRRRRSRRGVRLELRRDHDVGRQQRSRRRTPRPAAGSRGRCRAGRPRAGSCRPRGPAPRGR